MDGLNGGRGGPAAISRTGGVRGRLPTPAVRSAETAQRTGGGIVGRTVPQATAGLGRTPPADGADDRPVRPAGVRSVLRGGRLGRTAPAAGAGHPARRVAGAVLRRGRLPGFLLGFALAIGAGAQPRDEPRAARPAGGREDAVRGESVGVRADGEARPAAEPEDAGDAAAIPIPPGLPTPDPPAARRAEGTGDAAAIQEPGPEADAGGVLPEAFRAMRRRLRLETPEEWSLRFDFQAGVVGRTHPLPRNSFRSYRIELVRRTDGSALWHHTYRFPSYGVGVQIGDFGGRPTDRGRPLSVYGFIQTPVMPTIATVDVLASVGMGVTSGWNPPAFEGYPFERHPTTRLTSYVDLGFLGRRRLGERLDLLAGFSLNHFSNGGVGSPNRGLTVTAPRVAIQHSLAGRGPPPQRGPRPPFADRWETRLDGGLAVRGVGFLWRGDRFGPRGSVRVAALKGSVWRRFYRIGQVGGGLEGSLETARPPGTARAPDADLGGGGSVGLYTGYEQIAGPFSIYLHFGAHLARTRSDERPAPYYRVGTIMRFAERWFTDVSFRFMNRGDDFSHDYIAWHLGYRIDGPPFPLHRR